MRVHCPACGSSYVRHARSASPAERFASLFGRHVLRCRDCRMRFRARVWRLRDLIYARCPDCFCEVLSRWSASEYGVTLWSGLRLFLGAQPYYCARCRRRFVSFRPRKRHTRSPKGRQNSGPAPPSRSTAGAASG